MTKEEQLYRLQLVLADSWSNELFAGKNVCYERGNGAPRNDGNKEGTKFGADRIFLIREQNKSRKITELLQFYLMNPVRPKIENAYQHFSALMN